MTQQLQPPQDPKHDPRTDSAKDRTLGLSTAQVTGSALAAMSGAFFASWLGTTGTLVGAAFGSVIATVGAAIYTHSIRRTGEAVKRTAVVVRQVPLVTAAIPRPAHARASDGPVRDPNAPSLAEESDVAPGDTDDAGDSGRPTGRRLDLPWLKVALASTAVLVAALGGISAVEAITGKPIASFLGQDDGTGTTVGRVVGSDPSTSKREQQPSEDSPATPDRTPSEEPSQEPQPQPEQSEPSVTPTVPDPTPSTEPTTPVDPEGGDAPEDGTAPEAGADQP